MTLEMHQDARRCVKLWGAITFGDLKPPTNGPGTARYCLLESAASHTSTVESIPRRERTRSVSLAWSFVDPLLVEARGDVKTLRRAEYQQKVGHICTKDARGAATYPVSRLCRVCAHDLGVICAPNRLEAQEWYKPRA